MNIVQIGTNTGHDSCREYVFRNISQIKSIHLVEPLPSCVEYIKEAYKNVPNVKIYNMAISPDQNCRKMTIYYPANDPLSQHSSFNPNHLLRHGHSVIGKLNIPCLTITEFFNENGIHYCDRLYIDTEGLDCKILLSLDFNKYKIQYIEFEEIHADGPFFVGNNYKELKEKLIESGYRIEQSGEYNQSATKIT